MAHEFSIFFPADVLGKQSQFVWRVSPMAHVHNGTAVQSFGMFKRPLSHVKGMLLGSTGKYRTVSWEEEEQCVCVRTVWPQGVQGK